MVWELDYNIQRNTWVARRTEGPNSVSVDLHLSSGQRRELFNAEAKLFGRKPQSRAFLISGHRQISNALAFELGWKLIGAVTDEWETAEGQIVRVASDPTKFHGLGTQVDPIVIYCGPGITDLPPVQQNLIKGFVACGQARLVDLTARGQAKSKSGKMSA